MSGGVCSPPTWSVQSTNVISREFTRTPVSAVRDPNHRLPTAGAAVTATGRRTSRRRSAPVGFERGSEGVGLWALRDSNPDIRLVRTGVAHRVPLAALGFCGANRRQERPRITGAFPALFGGGPGRTRTAGICVVSAALYHLSYWPARVRQSRATLNRTAQDADRAAWASRADGQSRSASRRPADPNVIVAVSPNNDATTPVTLTLGHRGPTN